MDLQKNRNTPPAKWAFVLVSLCIAAYLAVFAVMNVFGFTLFCDSDTYPDTYISKLMWEQKTVFPQGWIFGNQLYVIATPVLAALFYGLTGSINWAMILATETMTLFIILSFLWLLRAITNSWLAASSCCLLLIASMIAPSGPYSANAQLFFLQASYYACYLITLFVVYGDYVRSFQTQKPRPIALSLSVALSFATGMQSLRQTVIMTLPILACECFLTLRRLILHEKLWNASVRSTFLRATYYALANIAGVLIVNQMSITQYTIIGDLSPVSLGTLSSRLPPVLNAFLEISGLIYVGDPSQSWFPGFFALVQLGLCIGGGIVWLAHIKREKTPLEICWLLSLVGILGVCLSTIVFNITIRSIYLFLYYPLVSFSALLLMQQLKLPSNKCAAVLLLCILSLGNLFSSYRLWAEIALQNSPTLVGRAFRLARAYGYPSMAWDSEDHVDAQNMCSWAMENGYSYLYGNWEDVPHIAVHSDGVLTAGYWYPTPDIFQLMPYLNLLDIYGADENAKALYIFTPRDEVQGIQLAVKRGATITKVAEFGKYRAYISTKPLMHFSTP